MKVGCVGAGGMIGGALVARLLADGHEVRATDIKGLNDWWQVHEAAHNWGHIDASRRHEAAFAVYGCDWVFDLAENMGGIAWISSERVACSESIEIGINLLRESARAGVRRFFFASSACVYNTAIQGHTDVRGLKETDAWPAQPEEGYGLCKLYMEELCRHYQEDGLLDTRIARFHNVYGPPCSWNDGKEKSPAALARKVAEAKHTGSGKIEIWGDGRQSRSYCYLDDCVDGTLRLMAADFHDPLNIGSDDLITVNQLVSIFEEIAGVELERIYNLDAPQGVRGRNADLTLCRQVLGWEPPTFLVHGLQRLYEWIETQVSRAQ